MWLERLRRRLAKPKTSVQLCLLGVSAGLIAAVLIILFRLTIMFFQSLFLDKPDDFTTLPTYERLGVVRFAPRGIQGHPGWLKNH